MENIPKYRFVLFKLKGHSTWRMTEETSFKKEVPQDKVTATKLIEINRITGEVDLVLTASVIDK